MSEENQKTSEAKNPGEEKANPLFGMIRVLIILLLVGYLVWTMLKGNPKVQMMINHLAKMQTPAASSDAFLTASGETMGTFWSVKVCAPLKKWDQERLTAAVQTVLDRVDAQMSTYKADSEISRFNQSASTDWFPVSAETAQVVELAQKTSEATDGAFDATVSPLVNFWKFGPDKKPLTEFPSDATIQGILAKTGWQKLKVRLDPPALQKEIPDLALDLSAVAKGYAVDQVKDALLEEGLTSMMIDVGGENYCAGMKGTPKEGESQEAYQWLMAIEKPVKESQGAGETLQKTPSFYRVVWLTDLAIATSGDAKNAFELGGKRYSHIINPQTGKPTEMVEASPEGETWEPASVSVFGPSCAQADAFATALFVLGPEKGIELANSLNLPVLFILRSVGQTPEKYSERASQAFEKIVSKRVEAPAK